MNRRLLATVGVAAALGAGGGSAAAFFADFVDNPQPVSAFDPFAWLNVSSGTAGTSARSAAAARAVEAPVAGAPETFANVLTVSVPDVLPEGAQGYTLSVKSADPRVKAILRTPAGSEPHTADGLAAGGERRVDLEVVEPFEGQLSTDVELTTTLEDGSSWSVEVPASICRGTC